MTALLSARAANRWCSGDREGKPVKSSGRPVAALEVAEVAVCPAAAAEATEVSLRRFHRKKVLINKLP